MFAIIQEGHGVYGVGQTETEAIASCNRLGTPDSIRAALIPHNDAQHGDIVLVGCTESLYHQVMTYGFEPEFEFNEDGIANIGHASHKHSVEARHRAH